MTDWQRTTLSMAVPLPGGGQTYVYEVADTDRRRIDVYAEEEVASVEASVVLLSDPDADLEGIIESTTLVAQVAQVVVSGFTRGQLYELNVVFTRSNGLAWTRTLAIRCVA
jgi:hypothetical protein